MLTAFALCLALGAPPVAHPPVGTVVTASDTGKQMIHVGGGHFHEYSGGVANVPVPQTMPAPKDAASSALAEVNAKRAARGLPPFAKDEGLTRAAEACAAHRAQRGIQGHSANDFAFLPSGSRADAAGCAAWHPSMGWGACCTFESYTHAGAAFVTGSNGLRYMQLFVRNGGESLAIPARVPEYLPPSVPKQDALSGGPLTLPPTPRRVLYYQRQCIDGTCTLVPVYAP